MLIDLAFVLLHHQLPSLIICQTLTWGQAGTSTLLTLNASLPLYINLLAFGLSISSPSSTIMSGNSFPVFEAETAETAAAEAREKERDLVIAE